MSRTVNFNYQQNNFIDVFSSLIEPLVVIGVALGFNNFKYGYIDKTSLVSLLTLVLVSLPFRTSFTKDFKEIIFEVIVSWMFISLIMIGISFLLATKGLFKSDEMINWLLLMPFFQLIAIGLFKKLSPYVANLFSKPKNVVIIGVNDQSILLSQTLMQTPMKRISILGYFDDRETNRDTEEINFPLLGKLSDTSDFVLNNEIDLIFISLPMSRHPRILGLLDELKDSTASIYFVPDIFVTDLIQARVSYIDHVPVVAVCETPFVSFNGFIKRLADIIFSSVVILLISPILIAVAIGVKMSSPGPIIFKQQRYGLDGKRIHVFKFRSMTVCEDGDNLKQATLGDKRVTPFGAFLRKTSLDELPQFFNVLIGTMSVVGPRPHAIKHNEEYRKLIKGYMIRHKVKPGITGLAQVSGFRGETDTLDKMENRIKYDLEYLRNWHPMLDVMIVIKTVWLTIVGDKQAY